MGMSDRLVALDVSDDGRFILRAGLLLWSEVPEPSEPLLLAMGFSDRTDFFRSRTRLSAAIRAGESLSLSDWQTALAATETIFVSDRWGAGKSWRYRTAYSDEMTIDVLRSIQRLVAVERERQSHGDVTTVDQESAEG